MVDVSTCSSHAPLQSVLDRFHGLRQFLHTLGDTQHLLKPEHLATRLKVLDELDAIIGDLDPNHLKISSDPGLMVRANALRFQFGAANEMLYEAAHTEIALWGHSTALAGWLRDAATDRENGRARPGLSFDLLDEIVCGVLQLRGPAGPGLLPSPEMTAYQPTPVRHILDLIERCELSDDDILVDLGSGLGHVPLLVYILTGIRTLGIEVQRDHAASAQQTAQRLNLKRVQFVAEDVRVTNLSVGTVYYMFTPFTGSILTEVLQQLCRQSQTRPITICALGPCTRILQAQSWLRTNQRTDTERITIFRSFRHSIGNNLPESGKTFFPTTLSVDQIHI